MAYNASVLKVPSTIAIAIEVINGIYGNGDARKKNLTELGIDYTKVQKCVDEIFPIWKKYEDWKNEESNVKSAYGWEDKWRNCRNKRESN